ncbi:MAG: MFS transporter [Simkaniaceae bacterium]|nr:MFS transporter [Simkaniaceae bacterium]
MSRRSSLFAIFFTFFIDNLGATIIYPIFAPLFLEPSQGLISPEHTYAFRVVMLGLFLGAYPLAQFFLAPLLGDYADHHGRKKTLLITTVGAFVGYLICGWSIHAHFVVILFLGRLLMGAASGNMSICLTAIADVCNSQKEKVRFYTLGSVIAGFTFVLGPYLGGKLSDPQIFWLFTPSFPLFVGASLTVLNVIFLASSFKETIVEKRAHSFDFIKSVHNIQLAFKTPSLKRLYTVFFFYLLSWNMLFQFVPAYLVDTFKSSNSTIGDVSAVLGGCWILGSLFLKLINRFIPSRVVICASAVVFTFLTVLSTQFEGLFLFTVIVGGAVFFASFPWPLCASEISHIAPDGIQGQVMGLSQSIQSLAMLVAPLIVGPLLSAHHGVSFGLSALFGVVYLIIFLCSKKLFKSNIDV